jgi:hypothetical protein
MVAALGLVAALVASACVACSGGGDGSGARVTSPDERLSDAEWDYGASVDPDAPDVTYQPDVIIPEGGADTVVQVTGDGLTWILDGDAGGVDDLEVGKVLFLTNRAVGRVLAVEEYEGDRAVTLGPVDITEVIRDIDTTFEGPLDPELIQIRAAPDRPASIDLLAEGTDGGGASGAGEREGGGAGDPQPVPTSTPEGNGGVEGDGEGPGGARGPSWREVPPTLAPPSPLGAGASVGAPERSGAPAQSRQAIAGEIAQRGILPPVSSRAIPTVPMPGMRAFPLHGSDGSWGVELAYDRNGTKVRGSARIYLERPRIGFALLIRDGKIVTAEAALEGVGGLRFDFEAATTSGLAGNVARVVDLPVDISVPIFGGPAPLAVSFHQSFLLNTAFSAKQSSLSFTGDYAFSGSLRAGYRDGRFGVAGPSGLQVRRSILQSSTGVSLGVTGFVVAHSLRVTVGIGGFGFAVGPYVSLTSAVGVTDGSDLGIVKCKGATLDLDLGYGIGYVMPEGVVRIINTVLAALNAGQIRSTGGTKPITRRLATLQGYAPQVNVCKGAV